MELDQKQVDVWEIARKNLIFPQAQKLNLYVFALFIIGIRLDIMKKIFYPVYVRRIIMHKRWYDVDPTVSLAVSLMRNASEPTQVKCADFIIDYAKQRKVMLKSNTFNDAFNYILKRWYDKDKRVAEAFEYFENAPVEIQKEMSLEVISLLQFSELH